MLNYLWAIMILVGIVYAILTGNVVAITDAALDSAGEGISLCITMAGVRALDGPDGDCTGIRYGGKNDQWNSTLFAAPFSADTGEAFFPLMQINVSVIP